MGDRGIVVLKNGDEIACAAVYVHWSGHELPEMMAEAAPKMRAGDLGYATARLCGSFHERSPDNITGIGLLPPPADLSEETLKKYSHGDAGVAVWDVSTGNIAWYGGYYAREREEEDTDWQPPPKRISLASRP